MLTSAASPREKGSILSRGFATGYVLFAPPVRTTTILIFVKLARMAGHPALFETKKHRAGVRYFFFVALCYGNSVMPT